MIMSQTNIHTIAFYNLENLFDTKDDKKTLDDDFTPKGFKNWNKKRYHKKLYKLGRAISNVGTDVSKELPVIVGVAEIENKRVLKDLIKSKHLKDTDYDIVHFDSPDERGIDTGMLYQKKKFKINKAEQVPLILIEDNGVRDFTRDILYVDGELNGERIHVFVNHWPSRRSGNDVTAVKRMMAAQVLASKIEAIEAVESDATFIIMGDFNDDPFSASIKEGLMSPQLYNPMEKLLSPYQGSANYKGKWSLFDQIILSHNLFDTQKGTHSFAHADIFNKRFLAEWEGRYKGNPFRTYVGRKYLGGYSDHFPVYIQLKLNS